MGNGLSDRGGCQGRWRAGGCALEAITREEERRFEVEVGRGAMRLEKGRGEMGGRCAGLGARAAHTQKHRGEDTAQKP